MSVHGIDIDLRHHDRGANPARRASRAEQVSRGETVIPERARPGPAPGPDAGQGTLLANSRFILPPELNWLARRAVRDRGAHQAGEVFFKGFLFGLVTFRVLRPDRHPTKIEPAQQFADAAHVEHNTEMFFDPIAQVDTTPAHHTVFRQIGAGFDPAV